MPWQNITGHKFMCENFAKQPFLQVSEKFSEGPLPCLVTWNTWLEEINSRFAPSLIDQVSQVSQNVFFLPTRYHGGLTDIRKGVAAFRLAWWRDRYPTADCSHQDINHSRGGQPYCNKRYLRNVLHLRDIWGSETEKSQVPCCSHLHVVNSKSFDFFCLNYITEIRISKTFENLICGMFPSEIRSLPHCLCDRFWMGAARKHATSFWMRWLLSGEIWRLELDVMTLFGDLTPGGVAFQMVGTIRWEV